MGVVIVKGEDAVLRGEFGVSDCNQWGGRHVLPELLWEELFHYFS